MSEVRHPTLRPIHDHSSVLTSHIRPLPAAPKARGLTSDLCRLSSGFTLIEVLVVIAMIAILAGLLYPAINGAQKQAKKVQAKNDLTQIVTAVNAFYTEYGRYPTAATTDAAATYGPGGSVTENGSLFNELRGLSSTLNTRQIVFISPPSAKDQNNPRSGIKTSTGGYYDPWGTEYAVAIDANYNNIVVAPAYTDLQSSYVTATDGSGDKGVTAGVIAWSLGADAKLGDQNGNFANSDDVISWQ
jgi:prepilin-type N-terminal cleavage/methylation domain-containing protein